MIAVCVMGLGYVGLPICVQLAKKFKVVGYDIDKNRIKNLSKRLDTNNVFKKKEINKKIKFTNSQKEIKDCNFFIICVPTPINKDKSPNLKPVESCFITLKNIIKKNDIIILESTVYPGITEKNSKYLEKTTNLISKKDFYTCYSPERINPGSNENLKKIDKILAIDTNKIEIRKTIIKVYKNLGKKLILTNNIREAETAKVIENIQRDMNIAFFNQILIICKKLDLNFNEVVNLASTKWNFLKFNPGLVGGHCLPVDPYYLSYLAKQKGIKFDLISGSRKINNFMTKFVIKIIEDNINSSKINVLILGITYKYGVSDLRNSLALDIYNELNKKKISTHAFDPFCVSNKIKLIKKTSYVKKGSIIVPLIKGIKINNFLKKFKNNKDYTVIDPFCYYS